MPRDASGPLIMTDNDSPRLDTDALSLHTIAERDIYATQEDGDFALAFSLGGEKEHRARLAARTAVLPKDREALIAREWEEGRDHDAPYRDDPNEDISVTGSVGVTPYRDDPEAVFDSAEEGYNDFAINKTMERCFRLCMRWIQHAAWRLASKIPTLIKHMLRAIAIALIFLTIWLGVAIIPALRQKEVLPLTTKQRAFELSGSTIGNLLLQRLFPQLEDNASRDCKDAWEELEGLSCHKAILSSVWDKGDNRHVREMKMDIWAYSELVCDSTRTCERAIRGLKEGISKKCMQRRNRFDLVDYKMRAYNYFDTEELDDGPTQVVDSIEARYSRLCDRPTTELSQAPVEWGTYAAELWMQWGIADGKGADKDLRDLRTFIDATSEKKTLKGYTQRGSVQTENGMVPYKVEVPKRQIGPGEGETDCGYSIRSWLERKWRSFEYGAVMNPRTDNQMGFTEFNELIETAAKRCEKVDVSQMITRQHAMWEQYGWFCDGAPCHKDKPVPDVILQLLHGLNMFDYPVNAIRASMDEPEAPREVLQLFHDSLLSMPCGIWIEEQHIMEHVAPSDYRVRQLCSNECRNSVDRIQRQIGDKFEEAAYTHWGSIWHYQWYKRRWLMNATCLGPDYDEWITDTTPFCAPGYAAFGHPEWILPMPEGSPSKSDILAAFAPALEALANSLPAHIPKPSSDRETQRRLARRVSESVCNRCASELLIGKKPDRDRRAQEFLQDDKVDELEYERVIDLYSITCAKIMVGTDLAKHKEN